ncbi:class II aldolase/adducin family protein [bacterium]|nr:class II aldolase/adducin family protein [bacterium]MBQ9149352.1 class II aldolase/adducin family protein [bacterium]
MEHSIKDLKNDIIYWSKRLYQKGMSPSTSGNISIRTKEGIYISASGTCLNDLSEENIVLIDYEGNIKEGNQKPSSEKIMHSEIYTRRDDINAIIHCHCPLITAFAVAGIAMNKPILPDFALFYDEIPLIPYYCPSSIDLAVAAGKCFEKNNVALLKNHGIILGDSNLQNAFYKLELIRAYVETYFGAEVLGGAKSIPKKGVAEIKKLYRK